MRDSQPHDSHTTHPPAPPPAPSHRLKYYLWDKNLIAEYFNTRNGMLGGDYSTKFSPWLAAGCLSPRTIYHAIRKYEAQRVANKSTYWVIFELIWRDFFRCASALVGRVQAGGLAAICWPAGVCVGLLGVPRDCTHVVRCVYRRDTP